MEPIPGLASFVASRQNVRERRRPMRYFVARNTKLATLLLVLVLLGSSTVGSSVRGAADPGTLSPTAAGLPTNLVLQTEGTLDLAEAAAVFPDPTAAARRLAEWGWREQTFAAFAAPAGASGSATSQVELSVQRFADGPAAAAALLDLAHARMTGTSLAPRALDRLGEQSWALAGSTPAGNEVLLGVQQGDALIAVRAISPAGDPLADAVAAATATMARLSTTVVSRVGDGAGAVPFVRPGRLPVAQLGSCSVFSFATDQWRGGFLRDDSVYYGRPWVAVYGAQSDYPQATVTFALDTAPTGKPRFVVEGLDDEAAGKNQIAVFVNDTQVYRGESPFAGWDGQGRGENAPWTPVTVVIPEGLLVVGLNTITFANLTPAANFSSPPYILLSEAVLTV
jgi:hypothetical protein